MMAEALLGGGARKVYILGRRRDVLDSAAAKHSGTLVPIEGDVTSKESLQSAVDAVAKDTGYVNLLIANSGMLGPNKHLDSSLSIQELRKNVFEDASMDEFNQTMNVNVTGAYFTMLAFLELLDEGNKQALKGGFGSPSVEGSHVPSIQSQVIFTSSIAAFSRDGLSPISYKASKAALVHLAKYSSTKLATHGIRVNVLAPGLFPSALSDWATSHCDPATATHDGKPLIPARKFGGAEEMGGTVLYLASRAGSYCNGLVLLNDGGSLSVIVSGY
ncbi:hypothetical protein B0I35DRAFT_427149 [Stachybotrys elegans]|uniref:Uncharacterized protein n=1 Tax=Stachybotrys elegans TaxID=80388 RepID=A0A8K0T0L7_9HYPO|nr:hypothetical protein B0I35DRAFT_427149 [Stachybotrys elegans]